MSETVLKRAEKLTEQGEYAAAIELLRATILEAEPQQILIGFLDDTERSERLAFRRKLADRYTNSFECNVAWIRLLSNKRNAHGHCCKLFEQFAGNAAQQSSLRQMRFRLAIDSRDYSFLCEDFVWLWDQKRSRPIANKQLQCSLLKQLARINDPEAIPYLQILQIDGLLDDHQRKILDLKCDELSILASIGH